MSVLYIGVTGNLHGRVFQHNQRKVPGFTQKYRVNRLIYYEEYQYIHNAITREKQLKGWHRSKKELLIMSQNPTWKNLSEDWF